MSYSVGRGSIAGRIGTGLGKGLSEEIPKIVERKQLSSGLKAIGENKNLSPYERLTQLATLPGVSPQLLQSATELLKQEAQGNALGKFTAEGEGKPSHSFPGQQQSSKGQGKPSATLETRPPLEETLKPYIPKSQEELYQRAQQLFESNKGYYAGNPEKAFADAEMEDQRAQNKSSAIQNVRNKQQGVQDKVIEGLRGQAKDLGVDVPGDVLSDIEDKAINAVKPISEGGEGLTEQQAKKKYGSELSEISRQYQEVTDVGGWKLLTRSPNGNKKALRSIRDEFKKRDDLRNFRDLLISENGLSPSKASYLALPVSDNKELNNSIMKLKDRTPKLNPKTMTYDNLSNEDSILFSTGAAAQAAKKLNKNDSLLSIAEELKTRGYDPEVVMDYFNKNKDKLNLSALQLDELGKPRDFTPSFDDLWMFSFSGLDNLLEQ